jgi:hypothetical protein
MGERKFYLVSWMWNTGEAFSERVAMTEDELSDLHRRLDRLEDGGDITDVYVGQEQVDPTQYDQFLEDHPFLSEMTGIPK